MNVLDTADRALFTAKTLVGAGVFRPTRPDRLLKTGLTLRSWGPTPAAGYTTSAIRYPDDLAVIDELGSLTFSEVHRRTNGLARALRERGVGEGDHVAVLCRNHRGMIDITVACSKLGAHALYLNTMFSAPQIKDVCDRHGPKAIVYDEEFAEVIAPAHEGRTGYVAWTEAESAGSHADEVLEDLIRGGDPSDLSPPSQKGRVTILTSGTTGTPKGANRKQPDSLEPVAALLDRIPYRAREHHHIAAPMFHSWGYANWMLGISLSSTAVLRRKFDPEACLSTVAQFQCTGLVVVPVMLQRILELPDDIIDKYDVRSLRVIAASGSALPGELATKVMDRFGDVLYNLYGSTEVAWATIATPADLRAAPGTAGRPPRGTVVKLFDDQGREVPKGETGRIFVGNEMAMEGYTGGGHKQNIGGLLSSGDVGHFDADGRLFIDGRDDEMIVSGGENVFPREVEDCLAAHDAVEEVAVIGVDDEQFGQRLKAFVVLRSDVGEDELKAHVRTNLAGYKVPREIVVLDELPRNATGKVLKRELAER
ncbi:MAG TPA: acyl-CoA synthetase [Capillimicrobium sp.]|nr:acyl-CoA synthetase [Capillimicrobium sp.]